MTDLVTDEMVEAAARELFEWDVEEHPDPRPAWEGLTEGQRDVWRSGARATLTAAALLIAAAASDVGQHQPVPDPRPRRPHRAGQRDEHGETHTCPSWRASGERCSDICTDCGGKGWVA